MSNSETVCIDASIVLRYVLMPDDAPIKTVWQTWVKDEINLVAPSLLFYEVTNGLYQQQRNKYLSPETIWKTLELSLDLPITLVNEKNLHLRAREIAMQYKLPATYDAHYLALAEWMDIELWTADMRLVKAVQSFELDWVKGVK
jgi:predicted nucleic acid-binding protein